MYCFGSILRVSDYRMVALQEGRDYIGIDLNVEYLEMAMKRIEGR